MAGKVNFEKFFKNIKIKNPCNNEEIQFKLLANKVYLDTPKPSGNLFEDMVLNASAWTILQEKDSENFEIVPSMDDRQFIELFFNREEDYMREFALKVIENEFILAYIAIHDENKEFRWCAFDKVWDEGLLEEIALNSRDWELRLTIAQYYLRDVEILKKISRNCPDSELRNRARKLAKEFGPLACKSYI